MNVRFDAHSYSIWWLLAWLLIFQLMKSSAVYLNGEPEIFKARAVIRGMAGSRSINGALNFEQFSVDGPVIISGTIRGLKPGLHGLHIHQNGNLSDLCKAAGPHFNPFNVSTRRSRHLNANRNVLSSVKRNFGTENTRIAHGPGTSFRRSWKH